MQLNTWPTHSEDEIQAVSAVLRSGKTNYWSGKEGEPTIGQAFENEFADFTGARHAIAVTNGTTAIELALHGYMQINRDNMTINGQSTADFLIAAKAEVIVPCRTFIATASAVVNAGLVPVLADIDYRSLNVTVETLEACRTPKTIAVIVVHYAGFPCDMPAIMAWAKAHDIVVIEDCAHAHGARIYGKHVGTFGEVGCFSFCLGKIMSTGGEGGMVITNSDTAFGVMAARRDHGRYQMMGTKDMTTFQWTVEEFGSNLRMTNMQAAIGSLQLKKLPDWGMRRQWIAAQYDLALNQCDGVLGCPPLKTGFSHALYMYIARIVKRDQRMKALMDRGVPARLGGCPNIGYEKAFMGIPLGLQSVANSVGLDTLALPINPNLSDEQVEWICAQVVEVFNAATT